MPSRVSILPFFVTAATFFTYSLAQSPPGTTPPAAASAESAASVEAASAASAYSAGIVAQAAATSADAYYASAFGTSGVASASSAAITGPDACGPKIPDPRVTDSCDSYVEQVDSPAPYGVQCLNDGSGQELNVTSCEELIPIMCSNEFQHAGEWVWATNDGCSLGSFLPPESYAGAAQWPPQSNCEVLIYGAMLEACADGSNKYNVAAVNLQTLPNEAANGHGSAVNVGYPSYLIAETQPRNLSDVPNTNGPAVDLDVVSIIQQEYAQVEEAYSSESAILATMTGSAAAAARSELAEYMADEVLG